MPSNEDLAFARVVVERKVCTQEQVNECLLAQSYEEEPKPSLEEIMVFRALLTAEQQRQVREAIVKSAEPPVAAEPAKPPAGEKAREDEQKQKMQALLEKLAARANSKVEKTVPPPAAAVKPPPRPSAAPAPSPPSKGPTVKATCAICGAAFEGVVDRGGRVRCPECHSSFTPRGN